ncbi:hypothetical protein [Umezawaea sp.]
MRPYPTSRGAENALRVEEINMGVKVVAAVLVSALLLTAVAVVARVFLS